MLKRPVFGTSSPLQEAYCFENPGLATVIPFAAGLPGVDAEYRENLLCFAATVAEYDAPLSFDQASRRLENYATKHSLLSYMILRLPCKGFKTAGLQDFVWSITDLKVFALLLMEKVIV